MTVTPSLQVVNTAADCFLLSIQKLKHSRYCEFARGQLKHRLLIELSTSPESGLCIL